jgi:myo-inositol catabolism protein IolS
MLNLKAKLEQSPLGMGGSFYGLDHAKLEGEMDILAAWETAFTLGIRHFDTATGYGDGYSERLLGRFIAGKRDQIFLASKANLDATSSQAILDAIDASLKRLQTDVIDLYYLHWSRTGKDMRPWMMGLETARRQGKIRFIGVSNFSVSQMEQLSEVGQIDACQMGYNLLWRFNERDILPYCAKHDIAVIAYSALAHGILSGKYPRELEFAPNDQRLGIRLFKPDAWAQVFVGVEAFKRFAERENLTLADLALRWLLQQTSISSVLVSSKNKQQVLENQKALTLEIPDRVFDELTSLSDNLVKTLPDDRDLFGYQP